jgi:hypothetical protein
MIHGAFQSALGSSILVSKSVGAIAALASIAICVGLWRGRVGAAGAFAAGALCVLVYLAFSNVTFWTRADPLLVLCSAVALFGATRRSPLPAAAWIGLALGLAFGLKATGPLYVLPAAAIAMRTHPIGRLAVCVPIAFGVGALPFLMERVSLANYVDYLRLSASNGVMWSKVRQNLEWATFLVLPMVLAGAGRADERSRITRVIVAASILSVALVGAKPGGGPYHLLPFVPSLALLALTRWNEGGRPVGVWLAAFAATAGILAIASQSRLVQTIRARHLDQVIADVREAVERAAGQKVAVGYAGTSYTSHARVDVVFRTGEYLLDAPAVQEHRLAGLPMPSATLRAIETCSVPVWLLPRDGEPFKVPTAYGEMGPVEVFPDDFRAAFLARYERRFSTRFFDAWECRR